MHKKQKYLTSEKKWVFNYCKRIKGMCSSKVNSF